MAYALIVPKIMEKNIQMPKIPIESVFFMKQIFFGGKSIISHWSLIPEFPVPKAIKEGIVAMSWGNMSWEHIVA